jgi:uncharacterized protein (TIGR02147 family)
MQQGTRIFEFIDYRSFVQRRLKQMPRAGRGQLLRMAQHLKVHPTLVSQVFKGSREFTLEQACLLCDFFGLTDFETDYFLVMVELERAGNEKLRRVLRQRMERLKRESRQVASRLPPTATLSDDQKATFYSSWHYSAVRQLSSIEDLQSVEAIAEYLELPMAQARRIATFLVSCGLCVEEKGRLKMGPLRTHLPADSPLIARHHANWRLKAIERHERMSDAELAFTAPLSISAKDFGKVREILLNAIEQSSKVVEGSEPEKVACLNIDFLEVR